MCWCDIYIEYTKLSMAIFSNLTFILYITAGESVRIFTLLLRYGWVTFHYRRPSSLCPTDIQADIKIDRLYEICVVRTSLYSS